MVIRCWGSRGSLPVSGEHYLKYGGDTTCIEIRNADGDVIIIDAGSGIRSLGQRLLDEEITHISLLFTHAHWDHLLGFPFFKPIYNKEVTIDLYGCPFAQKSVEGMLADEMAPPHFPIAYDQIAAEVNSHSICTESFHIGDMRITPIIISHPNQGLGYKFEEDGKSFVFLTDNELDYRHENSLLRKDYLEFTRGANVLFHDAEYTREDYEQTRSWGHSTYNDALDLACDAQVGTLGLFHHNPERTDNQLDEIVDVCRHDLTRRRVDLQCLAVATGTKIIL